MGNMETKIYVVRHGQSLGNLKRQILGHTDLDLTELGREQAQKCADFLENTRIDKIFSSDLMRAYHTAEPHAKKRGLKIEKTQTLRELYFGDWEGAFVEDVKETELFSVGWRQNFGTFVSPNGESVIELSKRICDFILNKSKENEGKSLLFVFHAAAIRSFWGRISNIPFEELASAIEFPLNASVSTALYRDGTIIPLEYSNAEFL